MQFTSAHLEHVSISLLCRSPCSISLQARISRVGHRAGAQAEQCFPGSSGRRGPFLPCLVRSSVPTCLTLSPSAAQSSHPSQTCTVGQAAGLGITSWLRRSHNGRHPEESPEPKKTTEPAPQSGTAFVPFELLIAQETIFFSTIHESIS